MESEDVGGAEHPVPASLRAPDAHEFTRTRGDVARFQGGEAAAFDDIWRRYQPALELLLRARLLARLEPELRARIEADDVLQVASEKIREKLPGFRYGGPGSVLAWMSAIVQHVVSDAIRYWRADVRDPRHERDESGARATAASHPAGLVAGDAGPATAAEQAESRRLLAAALERLSERHQTLVIWRFFGGASWSEVAAEVGAPSADAVRMEFNGKVLPLLASLLSDGN
jgi:RNA polymerase sigma factor (sigma-70 family)